jgi:alpha-beta hydrolase superfamily lysophospholipase
MQVFATTRSGRLVSLGSSFSLVVAASFVSTLASTAPGGEQTPAEVKASFLKLLDRPKVPLEVRTTSTKAFQRDLTIERLSFASEKRADGEIERVPALLLRPVKDEGKRPAVIVLHGTGAHKGAEFHWLLNFSRRGMVALAIDGRFHGERAGGAKGAKAYHEAILRAWRSKDGEPQTHPFYYDTCWDIWRAIDYLQSRPDVDPEKIGILGTSKGGIETWLAAAVDDRVKAAVSIVAVQSFRWNLENNRWHGRARTIWPVHEAAANDLGKEKFDPNVCRAVWNKLIPGILDEYDCPSMIRLFAGRPLLILSGDRDPICPIEGAQVAFDAAEQAYRAVGASDQLRIMVAKETGHTITHEQYRAVIDWLVRWLRPPESTPRRQD